jgi:hypothetical protein
VIDGVDSNRLGIAAIVRWFRQLPFADNQQLLR